MKHNLSEGSDLIITPSTLSSHKLLSNHIQMSKFTVRLPSVGNEKNVLKSFKIPIRSNSLRRIQKKSLVPSVVDISIREDYSQKHLNTTKSVKRLSSRNLHTEKNKCRMESFEDSFSHKIFNIIMIHLYM